MRVIILTFLLCVLSVPSFTEGGKILVISTVPSYTHDAAYRPLWKALCRKGHEIKLLTVYPSFYKSMMNLETIDFRSASKFRALFNSTEVYHSQDYYGVLKRIYDISYEVTELIYKNHRLQQFYAPNSNFTFDLVIVDIAYTPGLYALAHRFNAPLIGITSIGLNYYQHYLTGSPVLTSHFSLWEYSDRIDANMSFLQKLKNFVFLWRNMYYILNTVYPTHQKIAEKYLGPDIPNIIEIKKNISLFFTNLHDTMSFARPYAPNVISFNSLTLYEESDKLPKALQEFVRNATNGFIYFSFGTLIKQKEIPDNVIEMFYNVFEQLPYKVVWRIDSKLLKQSENIYIASYRIPQKRLLAQENVKLFIYQGGLHSTEEAIHFGVPLIGIPLVGDQFHQIRRMEKFDVIKSLKFNELSSELLNETIHEVATNEKYKMNMLKLSKLHRDMPYDTLTRAVWWVEFTMRRKGVTHLHFSGRFEPWYRRYDVDIAMFLFIIILISLLLSCVLIYKLVKRVYNSFVEHQGKKIKVN